MAAGVGGAARHKLGIDGGGLQGPLAELRAPAWASASGETPGAVDLA
jgi:hypothetical protein